MGKINYLLPIYSIATQENLSKIQKIIMSAARAAIGNYCFRKSTQYILNKCKWFSIGDLLTYSSLSIIHKTITTKKPPGMLSYFNNVDRQRNNKIIATVHNPKSVKFNKFYIYKYINVYNKLDNTVKLKSIKGFKKEIKLYLRAGTISDTMD